MENKDKITKAINDWFLKFDKIKEFAEIHTEELPEEVETLSLQRSGVENLPTRYIGEKCCYKQYQYILLLKNMSEDDSQRLKSLDWLDDLSDWIHQQNLKRDYPILENKQVKKVSCANGITYETDEEENVTIYYIQLYFDIKGGNLNG